MLDEEENGYPERINPKTRYLDTPALSVVTNVSIRSPLGDLIEVAEDKLTRFKSQDKREWNVTCHRTLSSELTEAHLL